MTGSVENGWFADYKLLLSCSQNEVMAVGVLGAQDKQEMLARYDTMSHHVQKTLHSKLHEQLYTCLRKLEEVSHDTETYNRYKAEVPHILTRVENGALFKYKGTSKTKVVLNHPHLEGIVFDFSGEWVDLTVNIVRQIEPALAIIRKELYKVYKHLRDN